jgi:hypothetical protein
MIVSIKFSVNNCFECPYFIYDYYSKRCTKLEKNNEDYFVGNYKNEIPKKCPLKIKDKSLYKRKEDIRGLYIKKEK